MASSTCSGNAPGGSIRGAPIKFMPGTKMIFAGLKYSDDREAVIAYLKTQQ